MNTKELGNITSIVVVILVVLVLLGGVFYGTYRWQQSEVADLEQRVGQLNKELKEAKEQVDGEVDNPYLYTSTKGVNVKVFSPLKSATVSSPVVVIGEVPGNWSFEASFPVLVKDKDGTVVSQTAARVLGDWMTNEAVPFSVTLEYDSVTSGDGSIVLQKDNPSGLPENDDSVTIPLKLR